MSNKFSYEHYQVCSNKAKIAWIQRVLHFLGYPVEPTGMKDKATTKSLKKFQEANGLVGNTVICKKTFDLLQNMSEGRYSI